MSNAFNIYAGIFFSFTEWIPTLFEILKTIYSGLDVKDAAVRVEPYIFRIDIATFPSFINSYSWYRKGLLDY